MGDNEEHLGSMLFLDNYVQGQERRVFREFVNETHEEILREFFLATFLKEDSVRNWKLLDVI